MRCNRRPFPLLLVLFALMACGGTAAPSAPILREPGTPLASGGLQGATPGLTAASPAPRVATPSRPTPAAAAPRLKPLAATLPIVRPLRAIKRGTTTDIGPLPHPNTTPIAGGIGLALSPDGAMIAGGIEGGDRPVVVARRAIAAGDPRPIRQLRRARLQP